jgi:hypothetical protein
MKPLCIDLFCGLGGLSAAAMDVGYFCVGFDIERHIYDGQKYPAQLVLQDILTVHGSQFRDAAFIWASPPCQQYSWLAMPWSRSADPNNSKAAKALRRKWETEGPDNRLFDACFRIQREACDSAGRYIPMVVENVRGAQEWVGASKANFGSFHLWGDVGMVGKRVVAGPPGFGQSVRPVGTGIKGLKYQADRDMPQGSGAGSWFFGKGRKDPRDIRQNDEGEWIDLNGTKIGGDWFRDPACHSAHGSRSSARKAASAQIAKIPDPLARYIAEAFWPADVERAA